MLSWRRAVVAGLVGACVGVAQPALTTIQDTLYRADGSRFTGTMSITYNSFQGGDTSNIATANLTLQIVNGTLRVSLVPTTTASAGAQYQITYQSQAPVTQFTETWAVPPSNVMMRVRDVRVSTGTVVGGTSSVVTAVEIPDVVGLLGTGDRIEVQFSYQHSGTSTGFTGVVKIGGTTVTSRAAGASESVLVGKASFGVFAGAQVWDAQSWGSALGMAASAGPAGEDTTGDLTVTLLGQMVSATSDGVSLRNFTVVRYPAQVSQ